MKKIFRGPTQPPKKNDFGRTKAEMGRFSQKGLRYSFEILQGLISNKNIRIPRRNFFGYPPQPPKKAEFGRTKAKMGRFSQKGLFYSFVMLQGLLSNKNMKIPMKKKFRGPPLAPPPKKPILGGKKPKWAVSPRRVCATVLKFYRGS